jgi:hypothetical protein
MTYRKAILLLFMSLIIIQVQPAPVLAELLPDKFGEDYVFQVDDRLDKLAEKYYGTPLAYPAIVEATNAKAAGDSSYAQITNPIRILIGQKLFVLNFEQIPESLLAEVPLEPGRTPEEVEVAMMQNEGPSAEQLKLLASLDVKGVPPELFNEVWLNSEPLKLADLQGKVVIIEFWTFG